MKLFILLFCMITYSFANCVHDQKSTVITWTGFKLAKKIGVSGTFDKFEVKTKEANNAMDVLTSAAFNIEASTVNSKDKTRDFKIAKFVFSTLEGGAAITGRVLKRNDEKVLVLFKMNDVEQKVIMNHVQKDNKHTLESTIDMLSFGMKDEHAAIAKACTSKHEGKTWTDVAIKVEFDINCSKPKEKAKK